MSLFNRQAFDCSADFSRYVIQGIIRISPFTYGSAITGQCLKFAKGGVMPIDGAQEDRNDSCFTPIMSFHRSFNLETIAIVRGHEIWTDEQQNDASRIEMLIDFFPPLFPGYDLTLIPGRNIALVLDRAKMFFQFVKQFLIFAIISIGIEKLDGGRWPGCHNLHSP